MRRYFAAARAAASHRVNHPPQEVVRAFVAFGACDCVCANAATAANRGDFVREALLVRGNLPAGRRATRSAPACRWGIGDDPRNHLAAARDAPGAR